MNSITKSSLLFIIWLLSLNVYSQHHNSSFAIVIDSTSYTYLLKNNTLSTYLKSLEDDHLTPVVLVDNWKSPMPIRQKLDSLYRFQQLEGAFLIGDIPIAMIRNAQQLTSTFKMPQDMDWIESSVPSDRYYDDFSLRFEYIKQDSINTNLHYFNLSDTSAQKVKMSIYSGRIKPNTNDSLNKLKQLKDYLNKAIAFRNTKEKLNTIATYTAEGYSSNSLDSWSSFIVGLKQQFPSFFTNSKKIYFFNYKDLVHPKQNWLAKINNPQTSFAYFNGHGLSDSQILSSTPEANKPESNMANVSFYVRSKLRKAPLDKKAHLIKDLQNTLGLNDKWFTNLDTPHIIQSDSITEALKVISISDLQHVDINARLMYLDACLTGSFQYTSYIASYYPLNKGKNIGVFANSIGVLQDLWGTQLLGLLNTGTRFGQILKHTAYLETHFFGDPSLHFDSKDSKIWNYNLAHSKEISYWKTVLNSNLNTDQQALALIKLTQLLPLTQAISLNESILFNNTNEILRTTAYIQLRSLPIVNRYNIIEQALKDNYEFLKRIALYDIEELGDPKYIGLLINTYNNNLHSARLLFKINHILSLYEKKEVLSRINSFEQEHSISNLDQLKNEISKGSFIEKYYDTFKTKQVKEKDLNFLFTTLRAYRLHQYIPFIIEYISTQEITSKQHITILEAFSWFTNSYQKEKIIAYCKLQQSNKALTAQEQKEITRTLNILNSKIQ